MYTLIDPDGCISDAIAADERAMFFSLCPTHDDHSKLAIVSNPKYCREGFSVVYSHLTRRKASTMRGIRVYGHKYNTPSAFSPRLDGRGRLRMIHDGRIYFGIIAPYDCSGLDWIGYENLPHVMGAGIEVELVGDVDDHCVYVVSAPKVFATNTWTMSLLTGVVRDIVSGDYMFANLSSSWIDFLFKYVAECPPKSYKNISNYSWSNTFGVVGLADTARRAGAHVNHYGHEKNVRGLENLIKRDFYFRTDSAIREIVNLIRYVHSNNRNDLIDTSNLIL